MYVVLNHLSYLFLMISLPCSRSLINPLTEMCVSSMLTSCQLTANFFFAHTTPQNIVILNEFVPCYPSKLGNQLSCQQQQRGHVVSWGHWGRVPQWKDPAQQFRRRLGPGIPTSSLWTSPKLLDKLPRKPHAQNFGLGQRMKFGLQNHNFTHLPVCLRYLRLISSTGKKPTVAPYSGHMLDIVALSAMESWATPGP